MLWESSASSDWVVVVVSVVPTSSLVGARELGPVPIFRAMTSSMELWVAILTFLSSSISFGKCSSSSSSSVSALSSLKALFLGSGASNMLRSGYNCCTSVITFLMLAFNAARASLAPIPSSSETLCSKSYIFLWPEARALSVALLIILGMCSIRE
ncbi:hypothetical protein HAX54_004297, partial [Datura stramonium]|nr:hypothetical protein [Datura stramonium]